MVDPLSLAAVSATVLTQGIGFLYGQVGELLRRRRDCRAQAGAEQLGAAKPPVEIPPAEEVEQGLVGRLVTGPVDEQALDRHAEQLARLRGLLAPYVEGFTPIEPSNQQLTAQVEALRHMLEQIYQQHITLRGEERPATGTPLQAHTGDVERYAATVIASAERAVAVGRDAGTVITGDQTGDRPPSG